MGQSPIPHYYYEVVREESLCGEHALCEHVFSDKLIAGDANGNGKFHVTSNRVLPSAGARVETANCVFLSIG